jgi:adenosine deaminase
VRCSALLRSASDVEAAACALFEDLRAEGIHYAEVIFSPQVHLRRGLPLTALLGGLGRARRRALTEGGPSIGYIADGGRLWGPKWFEEIVDQVAAFREDGVVAIGLGGDERTEKAGLFRRAFDLARKAGLGTVAHAGEGTTPREVRDVIDHLGVSRIGHGIAAASDPSLLRLLARRGILLEICPTSNLMTGAVRSPARHPLRAILDAGVDVALGSDDRSIFGTTLRGEYALAVGRLGVAPARAQAMIVSAARSSFTSRTEGRILLAKIAAALRR